MKKLEPIHIIATDNKHWNNESTATTLVNGGIWWYNSAGVLNFEFDKEYKVECIKICNATNSDLLSMIYIIGYSGENITFPKTAMSLIVSKNSENSLNINAKITKLVITTNYNGWQQLSNLRIYISENKYLIKTENGIYKIDSGQLVKVTSDNIDSTYINENGNKITEINENIEVIDGKFKLISSTKDSIKIHGIADTTQMIVASNDFYTTIQEHIDFFESVNIVSELSYVKIAFSIDNGATWKSHDGFEFVDLGIVIPMKQYANLTEDEINIWNHAKQKIYEEGIDAIQLKTIDFNEITFNSIRFAYVIYIPNLTQSAILKSLKWQFDAKGSMKKMKDSEYDIEVLPQTIKLTPLVETEMIKVNILS